MTAFSPRHLIPDAQHNPIKQPWTPMKTLDFQSLHEDADDSATALRLAEIKIERARVLAENVFPPDDTVINLSLRNNIFSMRRSNAFSALETYCEIFHHNNHFLEPGFVPVDSMTIVDFGANEGFYIARLKQSAPDCRVYAFEPNPAARALLQANVRNNNWSGVTIDEHAIYSHNTELDLEIIPQIDTIGSIDIRKPKRKWLKDEFIRKIRIPALSADCALKKHRIPKVDILKIDIEGAEWLVLSNFTMWSLVERIVLEWHSNTIRSKIIKLLYEHSFTMLREDSAPGDYYGEGYFCRRQD